MKKIKIFGLPSHQTKERTSGVDFVRIIQPLKYLDGFEYDGVKVEVEMYDIHEVKPKDWITIAKEFDIVYLNYTVVDWNYAAMGSALHGHGKKIIYDIDDAIWYLRKDNVTYDKMQELQGDYLITCMLNDVDMVTTTNRYLKNIILDKTNKPFDKIKIFPNTIDFSLYNKTFDAKDTGHITLMHYGSTSHFQDLLDNEFVAGIDKVFERYPNVSIKFVGSFIQELKYKWGARCETAFGDTDIYKWISDHFPVFMEEADIIVAPLEDDKYNRSKSSIKFLETASAGKPGVFSLVRPYNDDIDHGKTGFLARTATDWFESLSSLIESVELRQKIGKNAFEYVSDNYDIEYNLEPYVKMFKEVVTS